MVHNFFKPDAFLVRCGQRSKSGAQQEALQNLKACP
jgi:hypothetical protein